MSLIGVIGLILLFSFLIVFNVQKSSLALTYKYPYMDCTGYSKVYKGQFKHWFRDAVEEYNKN